MNILYQNRALIIELGAAQVESEAKKKRHLVVSDLHVGFEEKFKSAGISIESNVASMKEELEELIRKYGVTHLVVNGDVMSSTGRISNSEWEKIPKLFSKLTSLCEVSVVPGNHDAGLRHLIPKEVELTDVNGILIGRNLVLHGHTRPLPKFSDCKRLIMAHLHPIYQERGNPLSGQPVWIISRIRRKRIFENVLQIETFGNPDDDSESLLEVVIMPSFNKDLVVAGFAGAAARQERRVAPILKELKMAEEAMVLTLSGEIIGDSSLLPRIL
ncbi:MAG: metallophosphoesterase [Nitrososphaerales archaeon]